MWVSSDSDLEAFVPEFRTVQNAAGNSSVHKQLAIAEHASLAVSSVSKLRKGLEERGKRGHLTRLYANFPAGCRDVPQLAALPRDLCTQLGPSQCQIPTSSCASLAAFPLHIGRATMAINTSLLHMPHDLSWS